MEAVKYGSSLWLTAFVRPKHVLYEYHRILMLNYPFKLPDFPPPILSISFGSFARYTYQKWVNVPKLANKT